MAGRARRPVVLSPVATIRRNFITKGFFGGNRGWLVAGGVVYLAGFLRRTVGRNEVFAAREVLRPGEFITIRTIVPPTRKERRATKRSA